MLQLICIFAAHSAVVLKAESVADKVEWLNRLRKVAGPYKGGEAKGVGARQGKAQCTFANGEAARRDGNARDSGRSAAVLHLADGARDFRQPQGGRGDSDRPHRPADCDNEKGLFTNKRERKWKRKK